MRLQVSLTHVFGFILLFLKPFLAMTDEIPTVSEYPSILQVREYAADAAEGVRCVVESILSIPSEEYTYQSVLKPWNQLLKQLSRNFLVLNTIATSNLPCSATAREAEENLNAMVLEALNYPFLYEALSKCSQQILIESESDSVQYYVAYNLVKKNWKKSVHLRRFIQEEMDLGPFDSMQSFLPNRFALESFTALLVKSHRDRDDDRGGRSYEGGITGKWGDGNGIQWEGYVKAEAHDDRGNYVEGRAAQKDDGTGEVDIHGGHESKNK